MSGSHGHGGGGGASRRTRLVLGAALAPFVVATVIGLVALWPSTATSDALLGAAPDVLVRAEVLSVERGPCQGTPAEAEVLCARPVVRLLEPVPEVVQAACPRLDEAGLCVTEEVETRFPGRPAGEVVELPEQSEGGGAPRLEPGDEVVLGYFAAAGEGFQFSFADLERRTPLLVLAVMFAVAVVAFGRLQGVRALIGVGLSLGVLAVFVLPAVLEGSNPLAVALVGSATIALTSLYLTHGFTARTTAAVLGTLFTLALVGVLSSVFVDLARFTGLADEEATFLQLFAAQVDLRGLLLGGMVIGALGVIDDVTVTQVAAVWELKQANPEYRARQLYRAAVRIGRDHIASTVNTLVLAYAGASLPLLLLFTQANQGLADVATGEAVAIEIVRTLTGSIGLVASVPFTTGVAALVIGRDPVVAAAAHPAEDPLGAAPADAGPAEDPPPAEDPAPAGPPATDPPVDPFVDPLGGDRPRGRSRRERRFWDEP